jgi:hypothetical protein
VTTQTRQSPVMDVLPWPQGQGFTGASAWWDYVLSKEESRRLDNLMGIALLDEEFGYRLLNERDDALLKPFGFSNETLNWLRTIQAGSLVELAQAIVSGPKTKLHKIGEFA